MPEGAWFLFLLKKRFFLKLLFCPFRDFRGGLDFISHSLHPRIYKESDNKTYLKKNCPIHWDGIRERPIPDSCLWRKKEGETWVNGSSRTRFVCMKSVNSHWRRTASKLEGELYSTRLGLITVYYLEASGVVSWEWFNWMFIRGGVWGRTWVLLISCPFLEILEMLWHQMCDRSKNVSHGNFNNLLVCKRPPRGQNLQPYWLFLVGTSSE